MPTDDFPDLSAEHLPQAQHSLAVVAAIIEGTLSVETDDEHVGDIALHGFQYFLHAELAKQQPGLSALYQVHFEVLKVTDGSRNYFFRATLQLKERVVSSIEKTRWLGVAALLAAAPSCTIDMAELAKRLVGPAAASVTASCPSVQVTVVNVTVFASPGAPSATKPHAPRIGGGKDVFGRGT